MIRLGLEFVPQRRVPWFGLAFLGASILASSVVALQWWDLHKEHDALTERTVALERTLAAQRRAQARQAALADPEAQRRAKERDAVLASLRYPWNQVFADIEQPTIDHLALLAFTHDQATRASELTVEALDVATLAKYVQSLNGDDPAAHWYIESYKYQPQNMPPTVLAQIRSK